MEFQGQITISRSPGELWRRLLDARILQSCIKGCERLAPVDSSSFHMTIRTGVGFLRGRFEGHIRLLDMVDESSCSIDLLARGRLGTISASTRVRLEPATDGRRTILVYAGDFRLEGKVGTLGPGLLRNRARQFQDDFFTRLATS